MRLTIPKLSGLTLLALAISQASTVTAASSDEILLGQRLFQDNNLSRNRNQACASCHGLTPANRAGNAASKLTPGFVDQLNVTTGSAVSSGSIVGKKGSLNAPSIAYAAYTPLFHWDAAEGLYVGGQFWNARAKNLVEQAKSPFITLFEMAMPNEWAVISRLQENPVYQNLFSRAYGLNLAAVPKVPAAPFNVLNTPASVKTTYNLMAKAISTFEQSRLFNKFNSKFDYVLAGKTLFTPLERQGFALFNDENKGNCAACHVSKTERDEDGNIIPPLFTDFTYDNIGLPKNVNITNNPAPNLGLGGRSDIAKTDIGGLEIGKHKVMTLRNIAITPPYGHNGVFSTLEQVVHFYNTRDTLGRIATNRDEGFGITGWPKPEIEKNVNHDELGNLGLTPAEEKAVVAFMKTLTDDYPKWGKDSLVPIGTSSPFKAKIPKF